MKNFLSKDKCLKKNNYLIYDEKAMTVRAIHPVTGNVRVFDITEQWSGVATYWTIGNHPINGISDFIRDCVCVDTLGKDDDLRRDISMNLQGIDFAWADNKSIGFVSIKNLVDFLNVMDKAMTDKYNKTGSDISKIQDKPHRLAGHVRLEFE